MILTNTPMEDEVSGGDIEALLRQNRSLRREIADVREWFAAANHYIHELHKTYQPVRVAGDDRPGFHPPAEMVE